MLGQSGLDSSGNPFFHFPFIKKANQYKKKIGTDSKLSRPKFLHLSFFNID
jgi:hypothetical protein